MISKVWAILAAFALAFPAAVLAAGLSEKSRVVFVEPQNYGHRMHAYELSQGQLTPLVSAESLFAQLSQTVVLKRGKSDYAIAGTTHARQVLILSAGNPARDLGVDGLGIVQLDESRAITAEARNALWLIDGYGKLARLAPDNWIDPQSRLGEITRLALVDSSRLLAITNGGYLVQATFDGSGGIRIDGQTALPAGKRVGAIVATQSKAWLQLESGTFSPTFELATFDYASRAFTSVRAQVRLLNLLQIDAATQEALARDGGDLVRVSSQGSFSIEAYEFFDSRRLNRMLPTGGTSTGMLQLASALPPPAQLPGASSNPRGAPTSKKVFEPLEPSDFIELARREAKANAMKELPDTVEARFFAEWINRTTTLRYYFKAVSRDLLKANGLKFQMDSLMVLAGKEAAPVRLASFLPELAAGAKAERAARCQAALARP